MCVDALALLALRMENNMDVYNEIVALLIKKIPSKVDDTKINKETKLKEDLAMDSMDLAEFLIEMESEFKIDLTNVLKKINIVTVNDAVEAVNMGRGENNE